jgi:hypothetical protein
MEATPVPEHKIGEPQSLPTMTIPAGKTLLLSGDVTTPAGSTVTINGTLRII